MSNSNHYDTLNVSHSATLGEIKQAYRHLAKLFHPDSQHGTADSEKIVQVNAAYEVLSDSQRRQSYDRQLRYQQSPTKFRQQQNRAAQAQQSYQRYRQTSQSADTQLSNWLQQVYKPVNHLINRILNPLEEQIEELAADPFDDELMAEFQAYLEECRNYLNQAQLSFTSQPNPANIAGAAASLYYCLNQLGDGIEELELFTLNYDDHYLHIGQELFRIAASLLYDAHNAIKDFV
ncbi:MAG: J domain-containing protein [Symploca sp. SIO2G7]|nr:J domain-containing protein [Symploca sp. SIO2G7]